MRASLNCPTQGVEGLCTGQNQQHGVLRHGRTVAPAGIDNTHLVARAALQIHGVHAGTVSGNDLQTGTAGNHGVAHHSETGNYPITVLQICNQRLLIGAPGVFDLIAVGAEPVGTILRHGLGD